MRITLFQVVLLIGRTLTYSQNNCCDLRTWSLKTVPKGQVNASNMNGQLIVYSIITKPHPQPRRDRYSCDFRIQEMVRDLMDVFPRMGRLISAAFRIAQSSLTHDMLYVTLTCILGD